MIVLYELNYGTKTQGIVKVIHKLTGKFFGMKSSASVGWASVLGVDTEPASGMHLENDPNVRSAYKKIYIFAATR